MKKMIGDRGIPLFYPYESMGLAYLPYIYHIFFLVKYTYTLGILAHLVVRGWASGVDPIISNKTHGSFRFQETILR